MDNFYGDSPTGAMMQGPEYQGIVSQLRQLDQQALAQLGNLVDTPYGQRRIVLPGQIMRFNYMFFKPGHDPQPLGLVAKDAYQDGFLHAINMHYLTMPKAKMLLMQNCNNPNFSYRNIMGDSYISGAYRTYHWSGVQNIHYEDCRFLVAIMNLSRIMNVQDLSAMVMRIRQMANEQVMPAAQAQVYQPQR